MSMIVILFQMETLKTMLISLLHNQMDRVTLMNSLFKLKVDFSEESTSVILSYRLRVVILERLINQEDNVIRKANYQRLKCEAEAYLKYQQEKLDCAKYKCSLAGCLFECTRHRDYLRHVNRVHPKEGNLKCQYGLTCSQAFSTLALLKEHINRAHPATATSSRANVDPAAVLAGVSCRCTVDKCGGVQFTSVSLLLLHLRNYHTKQGEIVCCVFEGCNKKYDNHHGLRTHFDYHKRSGKIQLKPGNRVHCEEDPAETVNWPGPDIQVSNDDEVAQDNEEFSNQENLLDDEVGIVTDDDNHDDCDNIAAVDEVFMMAYCDFLNRMTNFQFIPQTSVQSISEEFFKNYLKSNDVKAVVLKKSLLKNVPGITLENIEKVVKDVSSNDAFLNAQESLDTEYKRVNYLKENFIYVEPKEIVFNPKEVKNGSNPKAVMHYVPIIKSVINIVQDSSFRKATENNISDVSSSILKDIKDGEIYKSNPYFIENPDALVLILYSDAVELVNPLGAGRGKHKVGLHIENKIIGSYGLIPPPSQKNHPFK